MAFPKLLAVALDTGESADLAYAIKAMRGEGWPQLGQAIATAFAQRVQRSADQPCPSCSHDLLFHTTDLGCWLCTCQAGS